MDEQANENELPDLEQLIELLVYAPIGLLYEYETVLPQLIKRGKSQVKLARLVGQFAVKQGSKQVNRQSSQVAESALGLLANALTDLGSSVGLAPTAKASSESPNGGDSSAETSPEPRQVDHDVTTVAQQDVPLPIAGYDDLTARDIVGLLDDLTDAQLGRVRAYESANRNRKTVLSKIDRLAS